MQHKHPTLFFIMLCALSGSTACITTSDSRLLATENSPENKRLTFQQAYNPRQSSPRLVRELPEFEAWLDDKHLLVKQEKGFGPKVQARLLKVDTSSGKKNLFLDYSTHNEDMPDGLKLEDFADCSDDYSQFVLKHNEHFYLYDVETRDLKSIGDDASKVKNITLSPDAKKIAFTRNHNLFIIDMKSGRELQLTQDGSETVYNGYASWVYFEEVLGRDSEYKAFWWAPDNEKIAFLRFDDERVPEFPIFDAEGTHGQLEVTRYPKAGDPNPEVRLGIAHVDSGDIVWVDTDPKADHYLACPSWTPDSRRLLFQWMNRGQNNIKLYLADPTTGKKVEIYDEKQPNWVEFFEDIYIFKNGSGFLLNSDVGGWPHLYYYDMEGSLKKRLTNGEWSVQNIKRVDEKNGTVFFQGTRDEKTETHLYRVDLDAKEIIRLTENPGSHNCEISPEGTFFVDTYSNIHHPDKREIRDATGVLLHSLDDAKLPAFDDYALGKVELFTIPSGDGYDLPAMWTLPPDFDKSSKYPVIFTIYGGPSAGTVKNHFGRLEKHYLAQHGIIVISVDHRGSGHFGKTGTALMHRNLGKWETQDLITAVKWLTKKPFIDRDRIGIMGSSYGGYVTCMALTYGADYFTHGIANSSVTDWTLYDTIYTERYMDTPTKNPEGYEFGSVLTHAKGLKGKLFITHGTTDDNVHMQNTMQLISKLENMYKDFDLMIYPGQRHSISPPKQNHLNREIVRFWFRHFLDKELDVDEEKEGG
ncbi:MAG: S9 family peptidase [Deltaproteobacteria bacterium]|nr:S9 family peptidase [Deltaproteobacteria bacterium]